jgi:Mor family transcriptional regulator
MSEFNDHIKKVVSQYTDDDATINKITCELLNPFGGSNVYIAIPFEERNKQIIQLHNLGTSPQKIARQFSLTVRSVYKIVKNFKQ